MTRLVRPAPVSLLTVLVLALLLIGRADAQAASVPTVYVFSYQTAAKMGEDATFIFYRTGDVSEAFTVDAEWQEQGIGDPPLGTVHPLAITFRAGSSTTEFTHTTAVDMGTRHIWVEIKVKSSASNAYSVGNTRGDSIYITRAEDDPPALIPYFHRTYFGITADQDSVTEGETATFTVTRTENLSGAKNVKVVIHDPADVLLGDYWQHDDGPLQTSGLTALSDCQISEHPEGLHIPLREICSYSATVRFEENETSQTISLATRDDLRDIPEATLSAALTGERTQNPPYRVGPASRVDVTVEDNDTVSELELILSPNRPKENGSVTVKANWTHAPQGTSLEFWVRVKHNRVWEDPQEGWDHRPVSGIPGRPHIKEETYNVKLSSGHSFSEAVYIANNFETDFEGHWTYTAEFLEYKYLSTPNGNEVVIPRDKFHEYWRVVSPPYVTATVQDVGTKPVVSLVPYQTATKLGEGGAVTLYRTGDVSEELSAEVGLNNSWSTGGGLVIFPAGARTVDSPFTVSGDPSAFKRIGVTVDSSDNGTYVVGASQWTWVHITTAEGESTRPNSQVYLHNTYVGVTAGQPSVTEGGRVVYTVTRDGDLSEELTVDLAVNDLAGVLEGDPWETAGPVQGAGLADLSECDIPDAPWYAILGPDRGHAPHLPMRELCSYSTSVTFAPDESSKTLTLETRDDIRDIPDAVLTLAVIGEHMVDNPPYRVGPEAKADVTVTDNDSAPELTLSVDRPSVKEAFGVLEFTVEQSDGQVPGNHALHFNLRLEHDRQWVYPGETGWLQIPDSSPVRWYKEIPLEFSGVSGEFVQTVVLTDNLVPESDWDYTASLNSIELRGPNGQAVAAPEDSEGEYWRVAEPSTVTARVKDSGRYPLVVITADQESVEEGGVASFTLRRSGGFEFELRVRVDFSEPWHPERTHGFNPGDEYRIVTFAAGEREKQLFVTATDDDISESFDALQGRVDVFAGNTQYGRKANGTAWIWINDDDWMQVSMASDVTSVVEGGEATFTLTRVNNIQNDAIVGISIEDPGNFLRGNHWEHTPALPSSMEFPMGSDTATFTLQTRDDWRDIPDDTITVSIMPEPAYTITGSASIDVAVADNDVAPQISLAYESATVVEGQPVILLLRRIGDDRNPIEFAFDAGPRDSQESYVVELDPGNSRGHLVFNTVDDDYNGPDIHYDSTNYPYDFPPDIQAQYWTMAGPATSTATVTDNDLPTISVEALTPVVDEGQLLRFRIRRDGYTDPTLDFQYRFSQEGSAIHTSVIDAGVYDDVFTTGSDSITFSHVGLNGDGDDPDAVVTIELIASPNYIIDPSGGSGSVTVVDRDPAPVASIEDVAVNEYDGTVEFTVALAGLPSLRDAVTVDYATQDGTATEGTDYTYTSGTITFGPGETGRVISVPLLDDRVAEDAEETFTLALSAPSFLTLQDGQSRLTATATITDDEPVVSLAAVNDVLIEGKPVEFTLTRTGDTTEALTVWLTLAMTVLGNTTASQPAVTFPAGDAGAAYTIPTTDDGARTDTQVYTAVVLDPAAIGEPRIYAPASSAPVSVDVRDNDLPNISLSREDRIISEGETATFYIYRPSGIYNRNPLTVNISVTDSGNFLAATPPTSVTFAAYVGKVELPLQTVDDTVVEDHGKITVEVMDTPGITPSFPYILEIIVQDDDGTLPEVTAGSGKAWVGEGDDIEFLMTRTGPVTDALAVSLRLEEARKRASLEELADIDAGVTESGAYDVIAELVETEFPAGQRSITITRTMLADTLNTGDYTLSLVLLPGEYVINSPVRTVWVQDDDRPTLSLSPAAQDNHRFRPNELLTVTRTGDTSRQLWFKVPGHSTWRHPVPGSEQNGGAGIGSFRFDPGEASVDLLFVPWFIYPTNHSRSWGPLGVFGETGLVPVVCDIPSDAKLDGCGYAQQYYVGASSRHTFEVHNDFMGVYVEADLASVAEGEPATFSLTRYGGGADNLERPLYVAISVSQDGDYISGAAPVTVTFPANVTTVTVSIPTVLDEVEEDDGAITLRVLDSVDRADFERSYDIRRYSGVYAQDRVTTEVVDNDYNPRALSVTDSRDFELDNADDSVGRLEFRVTLDSPTLERTITVDWATGDDPDAVDTQAATAGVDYTVAGGTLTFAPGETVKTVYVDVLDDTEDEDAETFTVTLSNPSNATLGDGVGIGEIRDNDVAFRVIFSFQDREVTEDQNPVVRLHRSLTGVDVADYGPLTVNVEVTQVGDFIDGSPPTTVTFEAGSAWAYLEIPIDDDDVFEADGLVVANILQGAGYTPPFHGDVYGSNNGYGDGSQLPLAIVAVYDNDLSVTVADAQGAESVNGGDGSVEFTVRLNAAAPSEVTVDVATADGEAASSGMARDYVAGSGQITFAQGEIQKTFSVSLLDDLIDEDDETFTVSLSNARMSPREIEINYQGYGGPSFTRTVSNSPPFAQLPDPDGTGTILDDDAQMTASLRRAQTRVEEDHAGAVQFEVVLSHATTTGTERDALLAWQVTPGTATLGEDYRTTGGTLELEPRATVGIIEVYLEDDNIFEELLETFTVELTPAGTQFLDIDPNNDSIETSIRDDEQLNVAVTANSDSVAEGEDAVFTVTLGRGVTSGPVTVTFSVEGAATAGEDYTSPGQPATLILLAGELTGTISIPTLTDEILDSDETIEARLVSGVSFGRHLELDASATKATTTILDEGISTVSVMPGPAGDTVAEGAALTFSVVLSQATDKQVEVSWQTEPARDMSDSYGSATAGVDYPVSSGKAIVQPGDTTATFEVPTIEDTLAEGDEKFQVRLTGARRVISTSSYEPMPLGASSAVGIIEDNDDLPTGLTVTVSPDEVDEDAGATELTVTVSLDGTSQLTVDTPLTVMAVNRPNVLLNATLGEDYTAEPVNAVIPAGRMSVTVTLVLTPVDDTLVEGNEIARVSAVTGATAVLDIMGRMGVDIVDNDTEATSVRLEVTPVVVDEGAGATDLEVTATLVGDSTRTVDTTVRARVRGGTALSGEDYTADSVDITIPAGEMSKTGVLTLTLLDDEVVEGNETVEVSATAQGLTVTPSGITVTIEDDDVPPTGIGLTVTGPELIEDGSAVSLTVTAALTGGGTRTVSTQVTLRVEDVTAITGDDYSAVWSSALLTIPARQRSASTILTITPVDDNIYEGPEKFAVRGSNTSPGLTVDGVRHTIADDDLAPTVITLSFEPDVIDEKSGIKFLNVHATLEGDSVRSVGTTVSTSLVDQDTGDGARFGGLLGQLKIPAGATSGTATYLVNRMDDFVDNPDRTFTLNGTASDPSLRVDSASLIITDDDTADVTISETSLDIEERASATYTVVLDAEPTDDVTVNIAGFLGTDLSLDNDTLTFTTTNWNTAQTVTVTAGRDDDIVDDTATLTHKVSSTDPNYQGIVADEVNVSVTDTGLVQVSVSFENATYTVDEGDEVTVTVTLSADPERTVTIPIAKTEQDGASTDDYSGVPASVTFESGETEKMITFAAASDDVDDDDESVTLAFGATLPDGVTAGATDEATVSITDDDAPAVEVSFGAATYTVDEGEDVSVTVTLNADPEREVTIPLTAIGQDGADADDYSGVPASVIFNSGDTEKIITFTAASDDVDDDDESVKLGFGTLPDDVTAGATDEATVSIIDDDAPAVEVSFGSSTYTVDEGDYVTVTVTLDADPERSVTIPLSATGQGGADADDYSGVPDSVVFESGDTEKIITFTAASDDVDDDDESVALAFGTTLPDGVTAGTTDEATVSIIDDDAPAVEVSFGAATYTVDEGDDVTVTVTLSADPEREVTIPLTATGQDGADAGDYSGVPDCLVFESGETEKIITFTAASDDVDDDDESVALAFGALPDGVSAGTTNEATVSIIDDDAPAVEVSFGAATYTVDEGEDVTVTVTLSADPEREVTIPLTAIGQDGADADDYSGVPDSLVFESGETEKSFTFTAASDDVDDDDESVALAFGTTLPDDVSAGSTNEATVSIIDDDNAGVSISKSALNIEEGQSGTYTVKLDSQPTGDVTVTVGGTTDTDLSVNQATLTFTTQNWDMAKTVTVTAAEDTDALDGSGTLTHTVTSDDDSIYDGISAGSVAVSILDNETETKAITLTMEDPVHTDTDASGGMNLGDTLAYTITGTNSGNVPLENVNVRDLLIDTDGTDCAALAIGAECELTGTYTVKQADVDAGQVKNTATVTADGVLEQTSSRTTVVAQVKSLTLEKTSTAPEFDETEDAISYSYEATNSGNVTLNGTLAIDDDKIESGITCAAVPDAGLAPGGTLTCTGTYTVTQGDVDGSGVTNKATATLTG